MQVCLQGWEKDLKQDVGMIGILFLFFCFDEAPEPRVDCKIVPITDPLVHDVLWVFQQVSSGSAV